MGVLYFDGIDDDLVWLSLAGVLGNVGDGAWTVAILVKRQAASGASEGLAWLDSDFAHDAGFEFTSSSGLAPPNALRVDTSTESFTTSTFTSTASPYLFVVSKGEGSVAPRLAWKLGSGGAWSHEDLGTALPDQTAASELRIGSHFAFAGWFNGWIGVVAWWEGAMSDANKEACGATWRTSDLQFGAHGSPVFLCQLNVQGLDIVDLAGNAAEFASLMAGTLDGDETLDDWTFDGQVGRPILDYSDFPKDRMRTELVVAA